MHGLDQGALNVHVLCWKHAQYSAGQHLLLGELAVAFCRGVDGQHLRASLPRHYWSTLRVSVCAVVVAHCREVWRGSRVLCASGSVLGLCGLDARTEQRAWVRDIGCVHIEHHAVSRCCTEGRRFAAVAKHGRRCRRRGVHPWRLFVGRMLQHCRKQCLAGRSVHNVNL